MENDNWLGRDADEMVMAIDRRPIMERIKEALSNLRESGTKWKERKEVVAKLIEEALQEN
jgi:hypothetical protein